MAALVAVVAGVVVGFRAWLTQAPRHVTVGQAVERYRSTAGDQSSSSLAAADAPAPGVYVYATEGRETVDALGGDTHVYPSPTTITITATDCGFRMTWTPVTGRTDTTDVCRSQGGFAESVVTNNHAFFHISQSERFTCAPGSWWLPPTGTNAWTSTCQSDGGRTTARRAHVVATEAMAVGPQHRDALHVRFDEAVSGSSTGTSTTDLWLDTGTGLPLRETSTASTGNDTVIGHVTFDERIDLTLMSLAPQV